MRNNEITYPLTIEKQLERYYNSEKRTERHAVLWHTWNQNRRWITQLLEITLCSYPSYSKHDESHAQSVLHNIEMILGEERIAELSASDCFVLLHTVYIHDIGMCIMHQDRTEILQNREFIDMIKEMEGYEESSMHRAIEALQRTKYEYTDEKDEIKKLQQLYLDKLEVYYALIQLIGDFRRGEHAEKSQERLNDWVKSPSKLGGGFSLAGMPQRIFLTIASCARMHTHPDFQAIMELPQEDDGYVSDYIHPRFISVLLQLGDILDMDNNRFHPLMQMCMGSVPEMSQHHYQKHMAIRKLHIRPDKIEIEADCETQEALRLVRKECDMLKSILKEAGYRWAVICPPGYKGSLPTVESVNLYMDNKKIPEELVTTKFNISQNKAFSILEGANVYSGTFVFLREFLQNAVDATKIQYWNDCISTAEYYKNNGKINKNSPYDLEKCVSTDNYPIEIEMKIQKKLPNGKIEDVTENDIEALDEGEVSHNIYGVKIKIKDFGTGIDKESILNISKVGSSRKKDRKIIETMPEWLRPTAEFGIGLQSAFMLVGSFSCYTRTRSGERYEITFGSGSSLRYDGYINAKPLERESLKDDTFGACFEIFLPCSKKHLHQDCLGAWNGEDPFSEEYSTRRPIRHAAELIAQMAIYLNGLIGELLFPVHLNIFKSEFIDIPLEKKMIENIHVKWLEDAKYSKCRKTEKYERRLEREDKDKRPWIREKKSWVFYKDNVKDDVTIIRREIGNDIFLLDCRSARLHIWSGEANTFVTISAKNLLKSVEGQERNRKAKEFYGYEIYYKGIELQKSKKIDSDSFIEYVDIKGDLERDCLNLSRRGFTQKGEKYYTEKINVELQKSIRNVLKYLGEINVSVIMQEIIKRCNKIEKMLDLKGVNSETERELNELKEQVISAVILIFLSRRGEYNEKTTYEIFEKHKKNKLDELNRKIVSYFAGKLYNENNELEKEPKNTYVKLQENFLVFSIRVYNERVTPKSAMDLTDFFHPNRHFAILQKRDSFMDVWNSYLIELDGPSGENIYNDFKRLVFLRDSEERNEIYEKIDGWVEQIIKDARQKQSDERDFRQQLLMNWILKNVPTIAMLSDISGNIRINVLNDKVYPYIYMNSKFKTLILRRMAEEYEKNQTERFSTIAWQEREFLSCEQVPFSAYFVKRGMLAKQSYSKVIFPIDGKYLNTLHRGMEGVTELKYVKNMKRVLKELNIQEYLQTIVSQKEVDEESKEVQDWEKLILKLKEGMEQGNLLQSINEFFTDFITAEIKSNEIKVNMEVVERNLARRIEGRYKAWQEIYLEIAQIYLRLIEADSEKDFEELRDKLDTIREQQAFEDLCILIRFFKEGKWKEVFWEKVKDALVLQKYEDLNEERILDYIEEHGKYPISRENMEICYREFESEVLALFENVALEKVAPEIEEAMKMLPQIDQKTQEEDHGNDE